ncbi:MAG: PD40 domain-containing protein [Bacteroidetes bacterium]|nr:PD40 domain-containing protein [Bacteroidota bacterium]
MIKHYKAVLVILFAVFAFGAHAQKRELKEEAAYYFENKDYQKAYFAYDKLCAQSPKNIDYKFCLGYCCLFYPEKKQRAIEIFEDLKRTQKSADANYYLAKAYHINYRFDDAITTYNAYLTALGTKIKEEDKPLVEDAKLGIMNCENGKYLVEKKVIADIKNLGAPINTDESEYVPVISTDESILIYTYVGKKTTGGRLNDDLKPDDSEEGYYHEDIYIAKRVNDSTFSAGEGISNVINTKGNDAAIALSPDGNTLFTFTSTNADNGDIYMSTLSGDSWGKPVRLNKNINTNAWEGSCSVSGDGKYLYFASEREGGLGGRDLYVSEKVNGDWGPAKNLGPQINTQYDDDAPFIHPDGITLFFSSKGHRSIGGYDIMYSIKKENDWLEPISMGIPLNTTEDDRYYVINARGDKGYFSSNRGGAGGKGEQDIYTVTPGILGEKPILALLKGTVYADDKPTEAKIEVRKTATNESIGPYYSNSKSGKYLMALSPGNGYKITIHITVPNYQPIEEEIDVEKLDKFVEIRKDFFVYSPGFEHKKEQKTVKSILDSLLGKATEPVATSTVSPEVKTTVKTNTTTPTDSNPVTSLTPCDGGPAPDFSSIKGKSLNDPEVYKKLLEIGGNTCAEGLIFKVQIAAYRHPENYKYDHLKEFGTPEIVNYPDGVTRFTQLKFSTIKDAEAARQKIMAKGQNDAWITAFVNGKRYTLEELIMVNFLGKSIN